MASRVASGRSNAAGKKVKFEHRLVLVNWMLNLFGMATFENLAKHIREPEYEGFTEEGISRFHQCLKLVINRPELPHDILLAYDENIVRYWKKITEKRNADGKNLYPKSFQYLCLLFTEIYLDRYFRDTEGAGLDILFLALADYLAFHGPRLDIVEWQQHNQLIGYILTEHLKQEDEVLPVRLIDGHDLMDIFGLRPGRLIGELLTEVREAQVAGELSTREEAIELVRKELEKRQCGMAC